MKDFGHWFADQGKETEELSGENLPEGIELSSDGKEYEAECCKCHEWRPIYCDISEIPMVGYEHYCGGSSYCCP